MALVSCSAFALLAFRGVVPVLANIMGKDAEGKDVVVGIAPNWGPILLLVPIAALIGLVVVGGVLYIAKELRPAQNRRVERPADDVEYAQTGGRR